MPFSTEEHLSAQLDAVITNSHLHSVKDFHKSANPGKQSSLLTDIAEHAAAKAQVGVPNWVFSEASRLSLTP